MPKIKVRDIMEKKFFKVASSDSFESARKMALLNRVKQLVVIDGNDVVGVLTERDFLKDSSGKEKVSKFMTGDFPRVTEETTVNEAARTMLDNSISCLPVFSRNGEVVGIITETDLVKDLADEKRKEPELSPERLAIYLSMTSDRQKENHWLEEGSNAGLQAAITQVGETGEKLPIKFRESVIVAAIARGVISEDLKDKIAVSIAARDVYAQLDLINPGLGGGFKVAIVRGEGLIVVSAFGRCGHALVNGPKTIAMGYCII
ncbi:MAG: HutP family protein [Candidatus Wallbacteria bacterium]|nr:HutP family protein [Candidatus Wallbacteria bacterium]